MAASATSSAGRILISYRRDDSAYATGWLYERLVARFGPERIFKDIDSIQYGEDFVEKITRELASCEILLAVIGKSWLTVVDRDKRRRLADPNDFVRLEIKTALSRGIRVIPVLVDGARMPRAADLPADIAALARRQAAELSPGRFDTDSLLDLLDTALAQADQRRASEPSRAEPSVRPSSARTGTTTGLTATLRTSLGTIVLRLFPDAAPATVRNFVELAEGTREWTDPRTKRPTTRKLYDGTVFHRVIPNFMIQGGDPLGTGRGGPGYQFGDEFHPDLTFSRPYILAMANAGPGTNGSQFFITTARTPWLDRKHTIFGEVIEGADVVDRISRVKTQKDQPVTDVVLESVLITRT
jgi:peptidyl-prolyl cis-trans isomerase A (cyclophilin A)